MRGPSADQDLKIRQSQAFITKDRDDAIEPSQQTTKVANDQEDAIEARKRVGGSEPIANHELDVEGTKVQVPSCFNKYKLGLSADQDLQIQQVRWQAFIANDRDDAIVARCLSSPQSTTTLDWKKGWPPAIPAFWTLCTLPEFGRKAVL